MTRVRIESFAPRRHWVPPGATLTVEAALSADAPAVADVQVTLLDVDDPVAEADVTVVLGPGPTAVELSLRVPGTVRRGYGLRLGVSAGDGLATASATVEAIEGWWESPRHAAITRYEDPGEAAHAVRGLRDWQVTVVQHYDWMWRHYRYRPPDGAVEFVDPLGRTVSHHALRASIEAGHASGIAALAYGAVYGAEPEHVELHPGDRVFDETGQPLSLGGAFFINDLRPGSDWRARVLGEYASAMRAFDFDGIHMDTYGPPHSGFGADGGPIDFAALYPGLIEEAAGLVGSVAAGGRVLFNCVEGFPLEAVAPAPAAALYLELWPPDDRYADVVRWIDRARAAADGRQVVIAAYAAALKEPDRGADRAAAFEAVLLLGAVITAAGAYHHTLAEGDRLLTEGYYPAAVPMRPAEVAELRALWRFGARYLHLLSDPGLMVEAVPQLELRDAAGEAVPWSPGPVAGAVWVRVARTPGGQPVISLVDLRAQEGEIWTEPKRIGPPTRGLRLVAEGLLDPRCMSPWTRDGDPVHPRGDGSGHWQLPGFRRWLVVASGRER